MAAGLSRGLTLDAAAFLTCGEWFDYIIAWNEINLPQEDEQDPAGSVRMATQRDFDNF
jgi:hypothetical protein